MNPNVSMTPPLVSAPPHPPPEADQAEDLEEKTGGQAIPALPEVVRRPFAEFKLNATKCSG